MMSERSFSLSIVIPTKDRLQILSELLASIEKLAGLDRIRPEIIVADNGSRDGTFEHVEAVAKKYPVPLRVIKVPRGGKSAAANEAAQAASGEALAFLDDDVVVEQSWLKAIEEYLRDAGHRIGQGAIRLRPPESDDPEIQKLVERYRTIPCLEHKPEVAGLRSLNGGPGASGTSEDVDLARRLLRSGAAIGYAPDAIAYHRVERSRLTEEYFKASHLRQGRSRFLIRQRGLVEILFNLSRAWAQYAFFSLFGNERKRYRSKGRIFHYLGMLEAKHDHRRAPVQERVPSIPT
jgi:glycosyltransferase involved in cell wall biosynthesis